MNALSVGAANQPGPGSSPAWASPARSSTCAPIATPTRGACPGLANTP